MNITLVMVETADGKTTRWQENAIHGWSSEEDGNHFHELIASHTLLVMGSKTYDSVKKQIVLSPHIRRIVLTRTPGRYSRESKEGQLEFSDESPVLLTKRLETSGYTHMLLAGGSEVNRAFLADQLITDCMITIEPRFFGSGNSLFAPIDADIRLTLTKMRQLNKQGTLLVCYKIHYEHPTG